jgi:hypothetical protein
MAAPESGRKKPVLDPKALKESLELVEEFQPLLEILARKDLPAEKIGPEILKRYPPEVLILLRDRLGAARAALPSNPPGASEKAAK